MLTVITQQGQGAGNDESEEETLTPRSQWKQVPRKSTFSLKYVDTRVHTIINKEMEKLTIFIFFRLSDMPSTREQMYDLP